MMITSRIARMDMYSRFFEAWLSYTHPTSLMTLRKWTADRNVSELLHRHAMAHFTAIWELRALRSRLYIAFSRQITPFVLTFPT
jgi:hypothetical protein